MPRFSGSNTRRSAVIPATGTAAPPIPATTSAAAYAAAEPANAARIRPAPFTSPPITRMRRPPKRSTRAPAGMSAAAEPIPTAANTAPKPAGPRSKRSRISTPIAGRPNVTIENAAWEATARTRMVRWRLTVPP